MNNIYDENNFRTKYYELGSSLRFIQNWRYGVMVGYFLLLWGTLNLVLKSMAIDSRIAGFMLLFAAFINIVIWLFDLRTRDVYRGYNRVGRALERDTKLGGYYSASKVVTHKKLTLAYHTVAVNILFSFILISFVFIGYSLSTGSIEIKSIDGNYQLNTCTYLFCDIVLGLGIPIIISISFIGIREYIQRRRKFKVNDTVTLKQFHLLSIKEGTIMTINNFPYRLSNIAECSY